MSNFWKFLLPVPFIIQGSGSLSGSGSIAIPAGVMMVYLNGKGQNGTYDPGQSYIAPTAFSGHWELSGTYVDAGYTNSIGGYNTSPSPAAPTASGQSTGYYVITSGTWGPYSYHIEFYGVDGVTDTPSSPGQPFIAPSGTTGSNTTATLNGITNTWLGGIQTSATVSDQPLASTGAGQTLSYVVPAGGNISYSYSY